MKRPALAAMVSVAVLTLGSLLVVPPSTATTGISFPTRAAIVHRYGASSDVTPVFKTVDGQWLLVARQYPDTSVRNLTLKIFHLSDSRWRQVGDILFREDQIGYFVNGGKDAAGQLTVASLTGTREPDFLIHTFGADTTWLSVISHAGGYWHAVTFDYGTAPTIGIDALGVEGHFVVGESDMCDPSCAAGPETYAWYRFNGTTFVPALPPGPPAPCSPADLTKVVRSDGSQDVTITKATCRDGWAIAAGIGKNGRAIGAFEQIKSRWLEFALNDSGRVERLGDYPVSAYYNFAIPYSLLEKMCRAVGESSKWVLNAPLPRLAYRQWTRTGELTL